MKVDPEGIVVHLRRAVREGDRNLEHYLAGEIARHIARTDALEEALRDCKDSLVDAGREHSPAVQRARFLLSTPEGEGEG